MRKIEELIQHITNEKARNVFVIGPYIGDYEILTPEESALFTLKGLIKNKQTFFDAYSKLVTDGSHLTNTLASLNPLITTLYLQTVNTSVSAFMKNESENKCVHLKGDAYAFKCLQCHASYVYDDVIEQNKTVCSCGGHIRPNCLLSGEKYNMQTIELFEQELLKANTIFLIGFDFNELEFCKQLEVIAAKKASGMQMPTVVVVGECDKEAVFETFLPEFIVDEKPESAMARLIELMNKK